MNRTRLVWWSLVLALGVSLTAYAQPAATKEKKPKSAPKTEVKKALSTVTPVPRNDPWWKKRHESMNERVKKGNVDLILIGDSITHGWEGSPVWKEYYEKRNAVNLGIGGDQTQHVLWRLQHGNIGGISPKLAVLMIGTNNAHGNKPEDTAAGIEAIVKTLRHKLPQTKVLVLAIFPRGANNNDRLRQVNAQVNEIIAKKADGKDVIYLDIGKNFLQPDGTLTREIMPDLLHLTPKGYKIWAESIEPVVEKEVGKK